MKKLIIYLLFAPCLMAGCQVLEEKAGKVEGGSEISYNESKDLWAELKQGNGDSYSYTVKSLSYSGFGSRTTIKVENGLLKERSYEAFQQKTEGRSYSEEIIESYTETGDELGSHEEGAEALSIDELYELCISEYLVVNEKENTIYFDTTEEGVISECGYVPDGCADDCFTGFQISRFEWL